MLRVFASACLFLTLAIGFVARAHQAPPATGQAPPATTLSPDDERAITDLVTRFYEARASRDVPLYASLWSANAPRRVLPTFPADVVFPYVTLEAGPVSVSRARQESITARARVSVPVTITENTGAPPRTQRWIRNMGFVKEETGWRVWSESPAADELAMDVARATTDEQRARLLAQDPDLMSEELALAIEGQGDRNFQGGDYKTAIGLYELESRIGEQVGSRLAVARGHLKLGQLKQLTRQAIGFVVEHFTKALDGFRALGDRARMASAEIGMGTTYYMMDDQASREHYKAAVDILETLNDRYALANALHGYGNALFVIGDFGTALEAYGRSIAILEKAGTTAGVPGLRQAIGRVQKEQGDYEAAIDSYRQSLANFDALGVGTQWGGLKGLGDVYRAQGRFDLALEQYSRVLALATERKDNQWLMSTESDIGNVYMAEQQPGAALDHYQKSLAFAQQLRNQAGVARALGGIGTAHFAELRYEEALAAYTQALPIHSALNDKGAIAWTHAHIGLVQAALEKHEDALASYQRAFDIANALSDAAAISVTMTLLATEQAELDRPERALDLADRAAGIAKAIDNDDTFAQARVVTARVLRKQGDRDGAQRTLREAVAAVEAGRAQGGDEPRQDFFGDARGPYRAMALLMAEANKPAEALAFAERSQARLLADILTGNRSLITNGLSASEQEEERCLNRVSKGLRTQAQKERQRQAPDAARLEALKTKLAEADQQRQAFAEQAYAAHPALKLQRGFVETATLDDVASLLPDSKTAIIEFAMTEKQTLALVLTRPTATPGTAKPGATPSAPAGPPQIDMRIFDVKALDLSKRIREFRAAIAQKDPEIGKAASQLHDLLLKPLSEALAGKTHLIIVPDGPLWSLPFQALQDADGRFLIERCAVSYAPSLTALALVQRGALTAAADGRDARPTTKGGSSAKGDSSAKGGSPAKVVAVGTQQAGTMAERLALLNPRVNVKPMPNAELEAKKLALVYGPARAKVLVGRAATRAAVLEAAGGDGVLHLATVFVPSAASPMRSPFVLAAPDAGEEVLEAWELTTRPLPPVTVLSRVQAERVGGEGEVPVALAWLLFVGGTKTTVLATWPDDSTATMNLMLDLHRKLIAPTAAKPASASRALRQAILKLLATPQYTHPFYWANYAVLGIG
jgi:CHAT domain-containing protein